MYLHLQSQDGATVFAGRCAGKRKGSIGCPVTPPSTTRGPEATHAGVFMKRSIGQMDVIHDIASGTTSRGVPAPIDRVLAALLQGVECIASSSRTLDGLTQLALIDHIASI